MGAKCKYEILGKKFNYLEVLRKSKSVVGKFVCRCDCGNVVETTSQRLRNGRAKSCGCKKSELISKRFRTHGASLNGKNCGEYQSYIAMWHRCFNEKRKCYKSYGGSGITVEEESWLEPSPNGYLNFLKDMGKRPKDTSLDRIDGSKGYSKDNCRWACKRVQAVNTNRKKTDSSTSIYRGVSKDSSTGKYMARIGNGKGGYEWLGRFSKEFEAALAYNNRAKELHGNDAFLNDITKNIAA